MTQILVELLSDKRQVIEKITPNQIERFLLLLHKFKVHTLRFKLVYKGFTNTIKKCKIY